MVMMMEPYRCTYSAGGSLEYVIVGWHDEALQKERKSDVKTLNAVRAEVVGCRWLEDGQIEEEREGEEGRRRVRFIGSEIPRGGWRLELSQSRSSRAIM